MEARHRAESARAQKVQVLQVALAPAAVAQDVIDQRLRGFLVAALDARQEAHPPAATAQKARLDEIVAHDQPLASAGAAQMRQAGAGGKGAGADDRVVAPVIALLPAPAGHALGEGGAIDAIGELLHPGKDRLRADQVGKALDQPGAGIAGHGIGQPRDGPPGHQAVGIEHQHRRPLATPARHPVGDVADLAVGVLRPAAVIELEPR